MTKKFTAWAAQLKSLFQLENFSKLIPSLLGIGVLATIGIVGAWVWVFWDSPVSEDPAKWGQFGDYIGGLLSTIFAAFSFIGILVTVFMQGKAVERQFDAIKQEREIKDDEAYLHTSITCLKRAYAAVENEVENKPHHDRARWLTCARWLLKAEESEKYIKHQSVRLLYESEAEEWRIKFRTIFSPYQTPESMEIEYFQRDIGRRNKFHPDSVYVIYAFMDWPDSRADEIDKVGEWNMNRVHKVYDGARLYLRQFITEKNDSTKAK
ncbi:hypothetical protein ID144_23695 [Pseudomonas sp. JM0905a]|uniref:hypothetical protein n=1 Tax=Pseudomonas sp. JM0905a TaxID=2772484 RepID=UPI001682A74D|nr:hypothetical protein [Pseudomonas sp. JM0905a]MBD2840051.1 hypothetical protein [Pseudomonas sp. JM0905a]